MNTTFAKFMFVCSLALVFNSYAPAAAAQGLPSPVKDQAQKASDPCFPQGVRSTISAARNVTNFVGTQPGKAIAQPAKLPANASPEDAARGYLSVCGSSFGLKDQASELVVKSQNTESNGARSFVHFQQVYQGIPVMAGELIVQVDQARNIVSTSGELLRDTKINIQPAVDAASAKQQAVQLVAKKYKLQQSDLSASDPELWIYDPSLLGPDNTPSILAWRLEVSSVNLASIRELVLVDAQRGSIALSFNQIDTAGATGTRTAATHPQVVNKGNLSAQPVIGSPLISVYTMNHSVTDALLPGTLVCTQSNPTACNSDVDAQKAYQYALDTYNFYVANFGRDSIDGLGMTIISSVHYGTGYQNAFWNGDQMVYGDGYSTAEDVVGHELTHGVTAHESNLFYYYQSGAINESLSDVFGELIEKSYQGDTDWLLGENLPIGAIRDMANPPAFGNPDKMSSVYYLGDSSDNGGVHTNSGINNKAAYLMTDGASFNGYTITGLGLAKVAKIYYEVNTNLLTSGSDYFDLYNALYQGCLNLVGTNGITSANCTQVQNATLAVEMNSQPYPAYNPNAPLCITDGYVPSYIFNDSFESGTGNFVTGTLVGANPWYRLIGLAHSGVYSVADDDVDVISESYIKTASNIHIPAGAYLHFDHLFDFDAPDYDGGVIEYSTNSGSTWSDAGSMISTTYGSNYSGTINSSFGNPLAGRSAFTNASHGYVQSLLNLSSLAGQDVMFRWVLGTDDSVGYLAWVLDDIRVYTCVSTAPSVSSITRADANPTSASTVGFTVTFNTSVSGVDSTDFSLNTTGVAGASMVSVLPSSGPASIYTVVANTGSGSGTMRLDLIDNDTIVNGSGTPLGGLGTGNGNFTSGETYTITKPTPGAFGKTSPTNTANNQSINPTLSWNTSTGATSYEYCYDTSGNNTCDTSWISNGSGTSIGLTGLNHGAIYYWQVRANNGSGTTYADSNTWWSFTTLPLAPGVFTKSSPANAVTGQPTNPTLSWNTSTDAASYEYCFDTSSNNTCDASWVSAGSSTNIGLYNLNPETTYYWQVRAINASGTVYADSNNWWSFMTTVNPTISGSLGTGGANATMTYTGGSTSADGGGVYTFSVPSGWSGTVTPSKTGYGFSPLNRVYANVTVNQTGQDFTTTPLTYSISGSVGVAGATLSYTDGTPKIATVDTGGNYSFTVSFNWSGIVTPSLACYTFSPLYRSYSNVVSNRTAQNYTPTINSGCANTTVSIAGTAQGTYVLPPKGNWRPGYVGMNNGPVLVTSANNTPIIASERVAYSPDGGVTWTNYSELMGLPSGQLTTSYVMPWYNNVDLNSQLRFGNAGSSSTNVTVKVAGVVQGVYPLAPSQSARVSYTGLNNGPVQVQSSGGVPIIVSQRVAYTPDSGTTWPGFSELMGLPAGQLTTSYVLPWYNNIDLNTQVRFGNVGSTSTTVTVKVAGVVQGIYPLVPSQSVRVSYAGLNNGPVQVQSSGGVPIIVSERVAYTPDSGTTWTSFSELMGLPSGQLATSYVMPIYDNASVNSQLRFGNVGSTATTVTVTVAGVVQGTYPLSPSQSARVSFTGLNNGPVQVQSSGGVPIIASQRVAYTPDGGTTWPSFAEMMGLPASQLTTSYVMPWYNNVDLNTQLRIAVP